MASVARDPGGTCRVLFVAPDGRRRTIRLGKIAKRDAEAIARHVETLLASRIAGTPLPRTTATWLAAIGDRLRQKLARAGLVDARPAAPRLEAFVADYLASRQDIRPLTQRHLRDAGRKLVDYFGADRALDSITPGDAERLQHALMARYAPNTARWFLARGKQFFTHAVRQGLLACNPFGQLRGLTVRPNRERDYYVPMDEIQRLLDVLPTAQWRALVVLARFAGLRVPSEVVGLTWQDVNWDAGTLAVRSTKTAREGHGYRVVPLFPEVRQALAELFDKAPEGATHIFPELQKRTQGAYGLWNAHLRRQLIRYILHAGLKPWPRLWNNLRRSAAIDIATKFPAFAVREWLGHSLAISEAFYLRITPQLEAEARNFRRLPGGAKSGAADACNGAHRAADGEIT